MLVGESPGLQVYKDGNAALNTIASSVTDLGANLFNRTGIGYDTGIDYTRICEVDNEHYLTYDVDGLWDADTQFFYSVTPLAYGDRYYQEWIVYGALRVDGNTNPTGTVVAIHDAGMFNKEYGINPTYNPYCWAYSRDYGNHWFTFNVCAFLEE